MLIDCIVKCKVHSVICQFWWGRGVNLQIYPGKSENELLVLYALVFPYIYSYYLTVSNGCSLTALSSVKFTQCSGSFYGGVNLKIYPGKSENEL